MKRLSLLWIALMLAIGASYAGPVDVNQARSYGQKFVQNTLGQKSDALSLAYTEVSEAGVDALYVFNYGNGFVVVAADDRAHPILGYTEGGDFDVNNVPEGLRYYLGHYAREIQYAIDNDLAVEPEIAEQWYLVGKEGVMSRTRGGNAVAPLLSTTWDQGWPYNYYAPACTSYWTNNHCYAGCVACAMSQVMKYWNWPETGNGEHSYSSSSYGGTLSANFGETTYNWSIMPNSVTSANAAGQAVALLMYHCGIAVDMDFTPDGSGAHTEDIPAAVIDYFRYGSGTYVDSRDNYSRTVWEDMLIEQLDRGLPVVYAGSDTDGGHAFNCDGYNDQRYFHFNWGWSGQYNNYYQIDALNTGNGHFNYFQRVVFDMVPDYLYEAMIPAMTSLEATVADALTKTVQVSFTVPATSESGADLTSIESIVLKRNGTLVQAFNNPQPGETITIDDVVDDYGCYEYTICGINNGIQGKPYKTVILVGPSCTWKFVCQTTNFQGWNGGKIQVLDAHGVVFKEVTMTNSSPLSEKFDMPEGAFSLNWYAPVTDIASLTINLKNSASQSVYSFSGSSSQLSGTIYSGDNDCNGCTPPTGFMGEYYYDSGDFGTLLTWNCDYAPTKFKIYRSDDGVEYTEINAIEGTEHEYYDLVGMGSYYYKVTAFSSACESTPALTPDDTDFVYVVVTSVGEYAINAAIFPNPVNDILTVQSADINEVTLYNTVGQAVYHYSGLTDALDINTSGLESGIYIVNVLTREGSIARRVVIMH